MDIPILMEDNHLLAVEKPVNIPVQADSSGDKDLLGMLKDDLKVRYQKPGNVFLGLIHRLDRPVGGVMVFAKTSKCASRLSESIRGDQFQRTYLAVVQGKLQQKQGILEHYLWKDRRKNEVFVTGRNHRGTKPAKLRYTAIAQKDGMTLLSVELFTGRSHQIRVQLSTINHPLYGDQKYGADVNEPGTQIALWAHSLNFPHPTKKEPVEIIAEPPRKYPWSQLL